MLSVIQSIKSGKSEKKENTKTRFCIYLSFEDALAPNILILSYFIDKEKFSIWTKCNEWIENTFKEIFWAFMSTRVSEKRVIHACGWSADHMEREKKFLSVVIKSNRRRLWSDKKYEAIKYLSWQVVYRLARSEKFWKNEHAGVRKVSMKQFIELMNGAIRKLE